MDTLIRDYEPKDYEKLVDLMLELQQHITDLDPLKRQFATRDGQQKYVDWVLEGLEKNKGKIFVAEQEGAVVGFVAGEMKEQKEEVWWTVPTVICRIDELCVTDSARGAGVGAQLMDAMEKHFKEMGCTVVMLGVFAPNTRAHKFYVERGYSDRYTDLLKEI